MNNLVRYLCFIFFISNMSFGQVSNFTFSELNTSHGLSDNQVRYILQLEDGRMVFTTSGNINIYDGYKFKYIHRSNKDIATLTKYDGHYRIYQSNDSLLWIKDQYKLMSINLKKERYVKQPLAFLNRTGISQPLQDFFLDDHKRIWLLSNEGLLQPQSKLSIENLTQFGRLQDLGSNGDFLYLFYNTGAVVCYDLKMQKQMYSTNAYALSDLENYDRTSMVVKAKMGFYQLRNGLQGGFFFFNPKTRTWKTILETPYILNTLDITDKNKAYISCLKGIWEIDLNENIKNYLPSLKTIDGNIIKTQISTLFYDFQGALWIGTFNRGLLYHHPSRFSFRKIGPNYFQQSTLEDLAVQSFAEDVNGSIYIKTNTSYYQYHIKSNDSVYLSEVKWESLSRDVINQLNNSTQTTTYKDKSYTVLFTDSRNWVWGGTSDGLELFRHIDESGKMIHVEDGLVNNFIHAILEDQHNQLWITTSNGISKIKVEPKTEALHFTNFNELDGTLTGEYLNDAAYQSQDGTLFFGGVDGFNTLSSNPILVPDLPFKPLLRLLRIHGNKIEPLHNYDNRVILEQTTPLVKELNLKYNENFLTLEYAPLNYINNEKTYYRYRLIGVDKDWVTVNPGYTIDGVLNINYTNLQPGTYELYVMTSNRIDEWQGKKSKLKITINPPWWRSPIAYIGYCVGILTLTFTALYFYMRYTKNKIAQQHREEILLLRIRNLIEQRKTFEETQEEPEASEDFTTEDPVQKPADIAFLNKAIEIVEKNLNAPNYTVENLSSDLNMERTGLYRKLTKLLEESPSHFIRNLRLKKAKQLILEGDLTITEIADRVGFSSSSYLSKCFKEVYGCTPSNYSENTKKST